MKFLEAIENNELVPFGNNYILFETSYTSKPIILEQAIFDIQTKGYIPVLAHPERYRYMHDDIDAYLKLKETGVLFQVNIKSLKDFSSSVYKIAMKLIDLGLIDFVGSDTHRMHDLKNLEEIIKKQEYKLIFEKNIILNNTLSA
jgi:tyrosine-protein phosphatase YwqE